MLIFQINQNELEEPLKSTDWLFWNNYLAGRIKENDYALLPSFIDYIQDTDQPQQANESYLVIDDNNEEVNT